MIRAAEFSIKRRGEGAVLALGGDWTATTLGRLPERLDRALGVDAVVHIDVIALGRIDTAGAFVLARAIRSPSAVVDPPRPDLARLLDLVGGADTGEATPSLRAAAGPPEEIVRFQAGVARAVDRWAANTSGALAFYGRLIATTAGLAVRPQRLRLAPTVALMQRAGLDALPIIAMTSFFVGATIAFLGATLLAQFGAQVFAVELVGTGVLREFGVLVTCIILAGRSASSFAAEIGAMKMNQEVDAMRTMGVDPFEALVAPRLLAMVTMTPLLAATAMAAGLIGGGAVIWAVLGLSPAFFVERLLDNVGPRAFWLGIVKSPVMALIIAVIGCRQGLEVGGDVEKLGRRVTAAVVQALFAIIICDALFALLFMELGV